MDASSQDHPHAATTRRQLGELGVMSAQVERAERRILEHAEKLRAEVDGKLRALRAQALRDDADGREYQEMAAERGRLDGVIERARQVLGPA